MIFFLKERLQEIVQQSRPTEFEKKQKQKKTQPWTLKVALRLSGVLFVYKATEERDAGLSWRKLLRNAS